MPPRSAPRCGTRLPPGAVRAVRGRGALCSGQSGLCAREPLPREESARGARRAACYRRVCFMAGFAEGCGSSVGTCSAGAVLGLLGAEPCRGGVEFVPHRGAPQSPALPLARHRVPECRRRHWDVSGSGPGSAQVLALG